MVFTEKKYLCAEVDARRLIALNLMDILPCGIINLFRRREADTNEQETSCTNETLEYEQVLKRPLASSLGARHKGCEISGHWTIRGQEVFLEHKRTTQELKKSPEITQPLSKADLKGLH